MRQDELPITLTPKKSRGLLLGGPRLLALWSAVGVLTLASGLLTFLASVALPPLPEDTRFAADLRSAKDAAALIDDLSARALEPGWNPPKGLGELVGAAWQVAGASRAVVALSGPEDQQKITVYWQSNLASIPPETLALIFLRRLYPGEARGLLPDGTLIKTLRTDRSPVAWLPEEKVLKLPETELFVRRVGGWFTASEEKDLAKFKNRLFLKKNAGFTVASNYVRFRPDEEPTAMIFPNVISSFPPFFRISR